MRHGVTGFVVDTVDEMVKAVPEVERLNPLACREHVARKFDVSRMADDYLAAYARIIMAKNPGPATLPVGLEKLRAIGPHRRPPVDGSSDGKPSVPSEARPVGLDEQKTRAAV